MANKQDSTPIRNWTEVERRLSGLYENIGEAQARVIKINNELANIMKSLLINLADYMDQGEVSLWFFSGEPTTENEPYISWENVEEHAGDFYYDRSVGAVYQFNGTGWIFIDDTQLLEAMAISNSELAEGDNERKVYLSQPTPPYEAGDWWIKQNGDLYICQINVEEGTPFKDIDFIISSEYSLKQINRTANTLTVLKGTITEITEDYVKFTDLSTAGSTTIAGENITTGSIKSNNYSESGGAVQQGTKINLNDGSIQSKNWSLSSQGKMTCKSATLNDAIIDYGTLKLLSDRNNIALQFFTNPNDSSSTGDFCGTYVALGWRRNGQGCAVSLGGDLENNQAGDITVNSSTNQDASISVLGNGTDSSYIYPTYIRTPQVIQTSEQSKKKNFEKLENALEIVKNTDIYKYHLKSQEDTEKKHVGFVIGKDFNYSDVITSSDNTGAELYSMISVLWQAVKEQQIEIENLRKKEGEN